MSIPISLFVSHLVSRQAVGVARRRLRVARLGGCHGNVCSADDRLDRSAEFRLEKRHGNLPVRAVPDARCVCVCVCVSEMEMGHWVTLGQWITIPVTC